jgi:hypothetical protein
LVPLETATSAIVVQSSINHIFKFVQGLGVDLYCFIEEWVVGLGKSGALIGCVGGGLAEYSIVLRSVSPHSSTTAAFVITTATTAAPVAI